MERCAEDFEQASRDFFHDSSPVDEDVCGGCFYAVEKVNEMADAFDTYKKASCDKIGNLEREIGVLKNSEKLRALADYKIKYRSVCSDLISYIYDAVYEVLDANYPDQHSDFHSFSAKLRKEMRQYNKGEISVKLLESQLHLALSQMEPPITVSEFNILKQMKDSRNDEAHGNMNVIKSIEFLSTNSVPRTAGYSTMKETLLKQSKVLIEMERLCT